MYCIIKCIVQGKQARVKNADLRHPSWHSCNVKTQICVTRPQCVNGIPVENSSRKFVSAHLYLWFPLIPFSFLHY